jgi:molybdenum cofactor synthesis domain-containing protein
MAGKLTAALLIIGDEVLRGETQDTNSAFLCRELAARGTPVGLIVTVPDDRDGIVAELQRLRATGYSPILTSGGIGPTPDDLTRQAVAQAFGVDLLLNQTAVRRYEELSGQPLNEKQLEMCRLPGEAEPIFGEGTGAPGFALEDVYVLPGVPDVLRSMFERVADRFRGTPEHVERFMAQRRESEFAALMEEYQLAYPELKFGSYPRRTADGGWEVEIRVRGVSRNLVQEAAAKFMQDMHGTPPA